MNLAQVASPLRFSRRRMLGYAALGSLAGWVGPALMSPVMAQHAGHGAGHGQSPATLPASRPDPLAGRFGGSFTLTRQDGVRVTEQNFLGRHMLVYFGFTRCTDTCPVDMPMIAAALDRLGPLVDRLTPVFVTVDPEDDPAMLREYLAGLHDRFVGLTGNEAELAAMARVYRVHRRRLSVPPQSGRQTHQHHHGGGFTIDHGSLAYLMDAKGQFVTLFPHGTGADRYVEVLTRYLAAQP